MPVICTFFGIVIRMYFGDHPPPHFHAEHQGQQATFNFRGELLTGKYKLQNRPAVDSRVGHGSSIRAYGKLEKH